MTEEITPLIPSRQRPVFARRFFRLRHAPAPLAALVLGIALAHVLLLGIVISPAPVRAESPEAKETRGLAQLTITTFPEGAAIRLDGEEEPVGVSPWTGRLAAGPHEIQIDLEGFMPARTTIILGPDDEREIRFDLLTGTPVLVPHGEQGFLRRQDVSFTWPAEGSHRGRDGAPMVLVPEGAFTMGSLPEDLVAASCEKPQHVVRLRAFLIDKYEVPNARYRLFLEEIKVFGHRRCDPSEAADKDHAPDEIGLRGPEWNQSGQPVIEVDWWDAAAYCAWAGKRLPTEAEWEKAARGADGRTYPWGEEPPGSFRQGNFADLSFHKRNPDWTWVVPRYDDGHAWTAQIGSFPKGASPYGAEDMAGNVWEWVQDWYGRDYYHDSPPADPKGPASGTWRVLRGGSWNDAAWELRVASRLMYLPGFRMRTAGFRCAQDMP